MIINYKGRKIDIRVRKEGFFSYCIGLMFKKREAENILFEFSKDGKWAIHSFFLFFPFVVLWMDNKNRIIETKLVKPWSFHVKPRRKYRKLVEIPVNNGNRKIIEFIVGKGKI